MRIRYQTGKKLGLNRYSKLWNDYCSCSSNIKKKKMAFEVIFDCKGIGLVNCITD